MLFRSANFRVEDIVDASRTLCRAIASCWLQTGADNSTVSEQIIEWLSLRCVQVSIHPTACIAVVTFILVCFLKQGECSCARGQNCLWTGLVLLVVAGAPHNSKHIPARKRIGHFLFSDFCIHTLINLSNWIGHCASSGATLSEHQLPASDLRPFQDCMSGNCSLCMLCGLPIPNTFYSGDAMTCALSLQPCFL